MGQMPAPIAVPGNPSLFGFPSTTSVTAAPMGYRAMSPMLGSRMPGAQEFCRAPSPMPMPGARSPMHGGASPMPGGAPLMLRVQSVPGVSKQPSGPASSDSLARRTVSERPITREELIYQGRIIERDQGAESVDAAQAPERAASVPPAPQEQQLVAETPPPPYMAPPQIVRVAPPPQAVGLATSSSSTQLRSIRPAGVGMPMPRTSFAGVGMMQMQMTSWSPSHPVMPPMMLQRTPGVPRPHAMMSSGMFSPAPDPPAMLAAGATATSAAAEQSKSTPGAWDAAQTPPRPNQGNLWTLGESPPPPINVESMPISMGGTGGSGSANSTE